MGAALLTEAEYQSTRRALAGFIGNDLDGEDALQEALTRVLQCRDESRAPIARVYAIGRNWLRDLARNRRSHKECDYPPGFDVGHTDTPEKLLERRRRVAALHKLLAALDERDRRILIARAEGLKLREIGELVGMDLRRVAEVYGRLVRQLSEQLKAE